jgi:hypothetical protein
MDRALCISAAGGFPGLVAEAFPDAARAVALRLTLSCGEAGVWFGVCALTGRTQSVQVEPEVGAERLTVIYLLIGCFHKTLHRKSPTMRLNAGGSSKFTAWPLFGTIQRPA